MGARNQLITVPTLYDERIPSNTKQFQTIPGNTKGPISKEKMPNNWFCKYLERRFRWFVTVPFGGLKSVNLANYRKSVPWLTIMDGCPLLMCQSYVPTQMRNQMFLSSHHSSSHKHEYNVMLTSLCVYQKTSVCIYIYMYMCGLGSSWRWRWRERERDIYICIYTSFSVCIQILRTYCYSLIYSFVIF